MKLYDSELKIMESLWHSGELPASELAKRMEDETGWNKNTTYTVIKKCIKKGAIQRREPGYICIPLIREDEVQKEQTDELIDRMFSGSAHLFLSHFLKSRKLSENDINQLKKTIDRLKGGK